LFRKLNRRLLTTNSVAKAVTQNIENGNYLLTKINGRPVRGLLDTGSGSTLINSSLARKLKLPIRPVQKGQLSCLFAAEGSKLNIEGVTDITYYAQYTLLST
jgi:predicted aspartyl protease